MNGQSHARLASQCSCGLARGGDTVGTPRRIAPWPASRAQSAPRHPLARPDWYRHIRTSLVTHAAAGGVRQRDSLGRRVVAGAIGWRLLRAWDRQQLPRVCDAEFVRAFVPEPLRERPRVGAGGHLYADGEVAWLGVGCRVWVAGEAAYYAPDEASCRRPRRGWLDLRS
jgi:hypothetical protein